MEHTKPSGLVTQSVRQYALHCMHSTTILPQTTRASLTIWVAFTGYSSGLQGGDTEKKSDKLSCHSHHHRCTTCGLLVSLL